MEEACSSPNTGLKTVEINESGTRYKCQILTIKDFIQVSLFINDNMEQAGRIHVSKIQNEIDAFMRYNINEIFDEINLLQTESFSMIKKEDKYILKIEFVISRKKKYLEIELAPFNKDLDKNDLIQTITELKQQMKTKDEQIKLLQQQLRQYQPNVDINDNSYNNFDIKLKEPIHKLKYHTSEIRCSTVLNDGRFVTGSNDCSIIIYNNKTFKPDLTIKEHSNYILSLIQLNSGILVCGANDNTIKLYSINGNTYKVMQVLKDHTSGVTKVLELNNNKLVSCSYDKTIIFYFKDNNEYVNDFKIDTKGDNGPIIQTKNNEICYFESDNSALCFFDLNERKKITKINNISVTHNTYDSLLMISNDLLFAAGENKLTIININSHSIIRSIDSSGSGWIRVACLINNDMIITGDDNHKIIQWKIEGDNLRLISKKENAHDISIIIIKKLENGLIISGDSDGIVKVW